MKCAFEQDLTAYLDRELPDLRARQLETHLSGCAGCQATVALLRGALAQVAVLAQAPAPEASPALRRAVLSRLDEPPSGWERLRAWVRPQLWVPALGLAAAAALVVVLSGRTDLPSPEEVADPAELMVASNLEVLEDLDVVGLESTEDLDVIEHLDELEGTP